MARRRLFPTTTIGLAAALLAGCASTPQVDPNVDTSGMPNAELALQRSLDRVDRTMGQLGRFGPGTTLRPVTAAELERPVSLAWSGPIDQGVKALADRIGYQVAVSAPANPRPIQVAVNMQAALTDHAVYTTIHAGTLSETVQRIVSLFPRDERIALTVAVAQTLRLIVNQRLVPATDGMRTALREFLAFDRPMRRRLAEAAPERWPALVEEMLAEGRGQSFEQAIRRALAEGRITEATAAAVRKDIGDVA